MKEDSQDRQLAMATKTPPLKRTRAFSNSFKIISARLKSQMLVNCPGVEFLRTIPKFTKKDKIECSSPPSCSDSKEMSGLEVIFLVHLQSFPSKIFFD